MEVKPVSYILSLREHASDQSTYRPLKTGLDALGKVVCPCVGYVKDGDSSGKVQHLYLDSV